MDDGYPVGSPGPMTWVHVTPDGTVSEVETVEERRAPAAGGRWEPAAPAGPEVLPEGQRVASDGLAVVGDRLVAVVASGESGQVIEPVGLLVRGTDARSVPPGTRCPSTPT